MICDSEIRNLFKCVKDDKREFLNVSKMTKESFSRMWELFRLRNYKRMWDLLRQCQFF